jgi:FAD-dependent halogenase
MTKEEKSDVLVIGGGPAGATLSALLARKRISTTLLEKTSFPRYHVGESLIPGVLDNLEASGALPAISRAGFLRKEGGIFRWGKGKEPWSFYFDEHPDVRSGKIKNSHAYQVVRSEFDKILLDHARECSVNVLKNTRARDFTYNGPGDVRVDVESQTGGSFSLAGKIVADCSGQKGWITRKMGLLEFDPSMMNIALFGIYTGAERLSGRDANGIFVEAIQNGWVWNIPLHNGTNSVGLITKPESIRNREKRSFFEETINGSEYVGEFLGKAELVSEVRAVSDYSYSSKRLIGDGFVLVGDSAGFIDPVWSSGVYLATTSARLAAEGIDSWIGSGNGTSLEYYETNMRGVLGKYREFIHYFYGLNRNKNDYFWKAHELIPDSIDGHDAFIQLVSGRAGFPIGGKGND